MKIKEVEKRVGITKANIRYYEEEGLIAPARNKENNYREYSEKDVSRLEHIKVLRMLGVAIGDIRLLIEGGAELDDVMERRLAQIEKEKKNLEDIRKVCRTIRQRDISFDSIDESILGDEKEAWYWIERLERIMAEDITKEILTPGQLDANIGAMLSWGYFLNAVTAFFFGSWMLKYMGRNLPALWAELEDFPYFRTYGDGIEILRVSSDLIFWGAVIISIICYVAMYFTASVKVHLVIFHIAVLLLTPIVSGIYNILLFLAGYESRTINRAGIYDESANLFLSGAGLAAFWLSLVFYVLLLWSASRVWNKFFSKARYVVAAAAAYAAVSTVLSGIFLKMWAFPGIMFFAFTLYIGLNWYHIHDEGKGRSRYYAVVNCTRTMNLAGVLLSMKGKTRGTFVFR